MNLKTVTLTAVDTSTVTLGTVSETIGGFTLNEARIDPAPRRLVTADLPLIAGGLVAPGRLTSRTVELAGTIVAPTAAAAHALARQLVNVVRDRNSDPVTIAFTPEATEVTLEGYLDGSVEVTPAGGPLLDYRLTLLCPDPVAKAATVQSATASGAPGATMTNGGNAVVYPEITATLSGTVTALRIGNTTTGEYLQLDGLAAGSEITVSMRPGYELVEMDGAPIMDKVASASTFWGLQPGGNAVYRTVTGGGSAVVVVEWRDGWVS